MIDKREKPHFVFKRVNMLSYLAGVSLILLFFVIYFIIAIYTWQLNFYSFFFHSIKAHLPLIILSGFHVGLLAIGILSVIWSVFNMTLEVCCFNDRFEISLFLQKKIVIKYNEISRISTKIFYLNYENLFKSYSKKECRVLVDNPIHTFYFSYPVFGYYDEAEIRLNKSNEDMSARCSAKKGSVLKLLIELKLLYSINIPYLPEEFIEQ